MTQKVVVIMPAYNAEKTVERTYIDIPHHFVEEVILVDDCSRDETIVTAERLGIKVFRHDKNKGYGGNQKTCYEQALKAGADIVVMLHPDYQYTPRLIGAMAEMIRSGHYDAVLGSRMIGNQALAGGMPLYKYVANRCLTFVQNCILGTRVSEYHTGFRAWSREVLENLDLSEYSDDFVFDNQMLTDVIMKGYKIGEISCPTRYFEEASSINFIRSCKYGLGCLATALKARLKRKRK